MNLYAYAKNNPMRFTDPMGLAVCIDTLSSEYLKDLYRQLLSGRTPQTLSPSGMPEFPGGSMGEIPGVGAGVNNSTKDLTLEDLMNEMIDQYMTIMDDMTEGLSGLLDLVDTSLESINDYLNNLLIDTQLADAMEYLNNNNTALNVLLDTDMYNPFANNDNIPMDISDAINDFFFDSQMLDHPPDDMKEYIIDYFDGKVENAIKDLAKGLMTINPVIDYFLSDALKTMIEGGNTTLLHDTALQEIYDVYIDFSQEKTNIVTSYSHSSFVYDETMLETVVNFVLDKTNADIVLPYEFKEGDVVHKINMTTVDDEGYTHYVQFEYVVNEYKDADGNIHTGPIETEIIVQRKEFPNNSPAAVFGNEYHYDHSDSAPNLKVEE